MFQRFSNFLNESKDQLDISILSAKKFLTSDKKREWFLDTKCKIEAKTDGVKLTIMKIDNTGDFTKDYIFSYKGNILYTEEFNYMSTVKAKKESVGAAQFKLVFEHFKKQDKNNIPIGTELFVEYLMKKSTLSSNYTYPHKMVLIGHSKSTYTAKFGKLKTKPQGFSTDKRDIYAKELKINAPLKLFEGTLRNFERGIINKTLKNIFIESKNAIDWNNDENIITNISDILLKVPSFAGGVEEGVVLIYPDRLLKIQQVYQVDQAKRAEIKMKYRGSEKEETEYWNNVKLSANEIYKVIRTKSDTEVKLPSLLKDLGETLKKYKITFTHPKKTEANIKDDIQLTAKTILIKALKGNNNALFFGKYRILTKAHYNIIKRGLSLYDDVVVALITSSKTNDTKDLRRKMLEKCFPNIEINDARTGNIITLLNKSSKNINVVIAGSDRVQAYREQLKRTDIVVKEIPRINDDISATKIIENINNFDYFKKNTPKQIHSMYNEILNIYK